MVESGAAISCRVSSVIETGATVLVNCNLCGWEKSYFISARDDDVLMETSSDIYSKDVTQHMLAYHGVTDFEVDWEEYDF